MKTALQIIGGLLAALGGIAFVYLVITLFLMGINAMMNNA